ncbi:MAG TPA: hypothetical protein VLX92_15485, partial [Kofleriaceae bacterium]|nr:hypothetical protein [Kofleriaceae bacterium]
MITTIAQARAWLGQVGIALRYGPHRSLPLASMYAAVAGPREPERDAQRRATVLANQLIGDGNALEIACVADRVALADAALAPPLIALVRRGRTVAELELSDAARRALAFVASEPRPTASGVRAALGVPPGVWPNLADDALAEFFSRYV